MVDVELGAAVSPVDGACKEKAAVRCLQHVCTINQGHFFLLDVGGRGGNKAHTKFYPRIEGREASAVQVHLAWENKVFLTVTDLAAHPAERRTSKGFNP